MEWGYRSMGLWVYESMSENMKIIIAEMGGGYNAIDTVLHT